MNIKKLPENCFERIIPVVKKERPEDLTPNRLAELEASSSAMQQAMTFKAAPVQETPPANREFNEAFGRGWNNGYYRKKLACPYADPEFAEIWEDACKAGAKARLQIEPTKEEKFLLATNQLQIA